MSTAQVSIAASDSARQHLSRGRVGMLCFIAAESAIFASFIAAYMFYAGRSVSGSARELLGVPIVGTVCLLSSSPAIRWAIAALRGGRMTAFRFFWLATLALGAIFIADTAIEWHRLIYERGFTIESSLFGAAYYALIGLHASHVIIGLIGLTIVMILASFGKVKREHAERCEIFSFYWHFVDAAWVVIFVTVYIFAG